jgi:hypothetical protein
LHYAVDLFTQFAKKNGRAMGRQTTTTKNNNNNNETLVFDVQHYFGAVTGARKYGRRETFALSHGNLAAII